MVFGVGIDLVETKRIENTIAKFGDHFTSRTYSENEIGYCQKKPRPFLHFAACFAVKEAFLKALGSGLGAGFSLTDIETIHDSQGKPSVRLSGKAAEFLDALGIDNTQVSISHSGDYVTAVVILAKEKGVHGLE
jgi:holo-[acyl-carrier protein] synthase